MNHPSTPTPRLPWRTFLLSFLAAGATGALAQTVTPVPGRAGPPAEAARTAPAPFQQFGPAASTTRPSAGAASDETVQLSPFEVVADNKGYFSGNTMSGTRLNSKLEDLAAAITIVTKEQMSDFAMLDLNDVFLYTAGTEGTGEYTDFAVNNSGNVADNIQNNPRGANRMRGIGSANISLGNLNISGLAPIDPLAIDGIEVSRGPNANVFGLGGPGGTVNMLPATANVSRDKSTAGARVDSVRGFRYELDVNRVLWKNKLALRASGAFQHDGYNLRPAGTDTVRYNGMIRYQPFKTTAINASFSFYRMAGNRPNSIMPRDNISYWVQSGKPAWDPVTSTYTVNGVSIGLNGAGPAATRTAITSDNNIPDVFQRSFSGADRSYVYVDGGAISLWTTPTGNTNNSVSPLLNNSNNRYMAPNPTAGYSANTGKTASQPLFTTGPSLSNDTYYDWRHTNLGAMNRLMDRTRTSSVNVQQIFFSTPRHSLAALGDYLREDYLRYQRNIYGTGTSGTIHVDVNARLLDGSVNPYFGRPYIGLDQPLTQWIPSRAESWRGQLAYKLDLSQEKNPLRWLGLHQLSGYDEYKYNITRRFSYRDVLASNHPWVPAGQVNRAQNGSVTGGPQSAATRFRGYFRYYVGDANGQNVDYAPTTFPYGPAGNYVWGNAVTGVFQREPAVMDQWATTDSAGGGSNSQQIVKTDGGVLQSMFLDGRLVTTFGVREDRVYDKRGADPRFLTPDGRDFDYQSMNAWAAGDYAFNSGRTTTSGAVVRPFRNLGFINREAQSVGVTGLLAQALNGLSLTYNKSDSFIPQGPAQDQFRNQLPNTLGTGQDYGFWLNLADGKFVLRVNRFETKRIKTRNGDAATIAQRSLRIDVFQSDSYQLVNNARAWVSEANPAWSAAQVQAEVARQTGLSVEEQNELQLPDPGISATQDVESKGWEIELNLNPTRYWTVASSFTDTQTANTNVSTTITEWINRRMPTWTTIRDPRTNTLWWDTPYGGNTAHNYYTVNVDTPLKIILQQQGKANPQIRRYKFKGSTNFQLAGLTQHSFWKNVSVGGALRWEAKGGIGYYGVQKFPATITDLDPNNPIWDKSRYYVDAFATYRTKLFKKIGTTFQFNVRNVGENGRLQPIGAYPDGTPLAYRIIDPALYILQVKFDL